jgi:hypothetical protein
MSNAVLRLGDTGQEVRRLTDCLVQRGLLASSQDYFDKTVQRAVKEFQSRHIDSRGRPLKVDGLVGPVTWWALEHPNNQSLFAEAQEEITVPRSGGSTRGRAALRVAISEIEAGAREIASDNSGPFVQKYLNRIVPTPAHWCAGFVSWCFTQHEDGCPFNYSLGARDIRDQFRRRGWLYEVTALQQPEAGDVIFWWRDRPDSWMGHVGFVQSSSSGIVYTIEGNKGGFPAPVRQYDYVLGRIDKLLGFGRVPF